MASVSQGVLDYCVRQALNRFDQWNDVAGPFQKLTGSYYEAQSVIEDAVKIGVFGALGLPIEFNEDGELIDHALRLAQKEGGV